uniref:POL1 protein n=1 Tax=Fopius arisanus TaxID=64838 RepID=A0A0C9QZR9_9HYME
MELESENSQGKTDREINEILFNEIDNYLNHEPPRLITLQTDKTRDKGSNDNEGHNQIEPKLVDPRNKEEITGERKAIDLKRIEPYKTDDLPETIVEGGGPGTNSSSTYTPDDIGVGWYTMDSELDILRSPLLLTPPRDHLQRRLESLRKRGLAGTFPYFGLCSEGSSSSRGNSPANQTHETQNLRYSEACDYQQLSNNSDIGQTNPTDGQYVAWGRPWNQWFQRPVRTRATPSNQVPDRRTGEARQIEEGKSNSPSVPHEVSLSPLSDDTRRLFETPGRNKNRKRTIEWSDEGDRRVKKIVQHGRKTKYLFYPKDPKP